VSCDPFSAGVACACWTEPAAACPPVAVVLVVAASVALDSSSDQPSQLSLLLSPTVRPACRALSEGISARGDMAGAITARARRMAGSLADVDPSRPLTLSLCHAGVRRHRQTEWILIGSRGDPGSNHDEWCYRLGEAAPVPPTISLFTLRTLQEFSFPAERVTRAADSLADVDPSRPLTLVANMHGRDVPGMFGP